ncbi:hypothetical protein K435DRAFT_974625 [Dendrothele bispora CBS 962.96]|uniref:Uncharacterized protein n=1 Tax=Dendrothele bispora (strain CBS 962.96) TaxID=1314807 RepID=A0A4S8KKD0_DENBC|nr:hypothetical protein K435DRAFT_974625 [Dendrothele bispora CBS 962.96]
MDQLKVPTTDEKSLYPSIIMHKLGSFKDDAVLEARLANIFHSEHTFLVNCSGSGKTRLLLEGLCENWGLFFTCEPDFNKLGSSEISKVINDVLHRVPGFQAFTESLHSSDINRRIAHRHFSEILLSRLLVFKLFLEYALDNGITEGHKRLWLLAQLSPGILWGPEKRSSHDYFVDVWTFLNRSKVPDEVIDDAILQTITEIIELYDITQHPFYLVLDEANYAAETYPSSFRDDDGDYPLLKEVLRIWKKQLGHLPISFVISGTRIPKRYFETKSGEWDAFRWCSDTGCFDNYEIQRKYVTQFLPPTLASSPEGEELLTRIWRWLRGRHRFTAGFITILLQKDFSNPHISLNLLVRTSTNYEPREGLQYPIQDRVDRSDYYGLEMNGIGESSELGLMMYEAVLHNLCYQAGTHGSEPIRVDLVTQSYGHFIDPSATCVAVDEPMILLAGTHWFMSDDKSIVDLHYFNELLASSSIYQCKDVHLVNFIALSLAVTFNSAQILSEVFTFADSAPSWGQQTAELVVRKTARSFQPFRYTGEDRQKLVSSAASLSDLAKWLKSHETPFFIYRPDQQATLLFALKLKNKKHIWIALRQIDEFVRESSDPLDIGELLGLEELFPNDESNSDDSLSVLRKGFRNLPRCLGDVGTLGLLCASASLSRDANIKTTANTLSTHSVTHLNREKILELRSMTRQFRSSLIEHAVTATDPLKQGRSMRSTNPRAINKPGSSSKPTKSRRTKTSSQQPISSNRPLTRSQAKELNITL